MPNLAIAPVKRILKSIDPNAKVSGDAVEETISILEEYGTSIAINAFQNALHAGRTTIQVNDIKLALTQAKTPVRNY